MDMEGAYGVQSYGYGRGETIPGADEGGDGAVDIDHTRTM